MIKRWLGALFVALVLLCAYPDGVTVYTMCDSGCSTTVSLSNLQTLVNNAQGGDIIRIQAGAQLSGTLVLKNHVGAAPVLIETGVTSTGGALSCTWPGPSTRLIPPSATGVTIENGQATNYTCVLAKITPSGSNEPAVRTQYPGETGGSCTGSSSSTCRSDNWAFRRLQFSAPVLPNVANGCIITLGSQSLPADLPNSNHQDSAAKTPTGFSFDQVYIHGTDAGGSLHGLCIFATNVLIERSFLSNHWSNDQDSQAIWVENTIGGWSWDTGIRIVSNYVEAAGENFLTGGDTPRGNFSISAPYGSGAITLTASSATSATLTSALPDYMREGDCVSVLVSAAKTQACIATIAASGPNPRRVITFTEALSASPDVPGAMRGGVVPYYLTVEYNWFNKPTAWRGSAKSVKNLFELKTGKYVRVRYNYMSNTWLASQTGVAVLFTPLNQDGGNDSTTLASVSYDYNVVEHATGGITITGIDATNEFGQRATDISITHSAFLDMDALAWGDGVTYYPTIPIGHGHNPIRAMPKNLTIDHILVESITGSALFLWSTDASTAPQLAAMLKAENFVLKNSILRSGPALAFGFCDELTGCSYTTGSASWNAAVGSGTGTCANNAFGGQSSGNWTFCSGAIFPSNAALQDATVSWGTDYSADVSGIFDDTANDGTDMGPDWTILTLAKAAAIAGYRGVCP
jgi:hypothetical protein